jgi:UDP-N-acetylglucosamine 1-carboxyvinyltransferase
LESKFQYNEKRFTFQADEVNIGYLETEAFKKRQLIEGSIMIVGPLLAQFGKDVRVTKGWSSSIGYTHF